MRITLGIGGSVLISESGPNTEIVARAVRAVKNLQQEGHQIFIVVGGGATARKYMEMGKKLDLKGAQLDELGILVTRLNAKFFLFTMGESFDVEVPSTIESAIDLSLRGKTPVMGGTVPGHTTDAVAAMLANASGSELLVFITNVDGVYTADPKRYPGAKKIPKLTTRELVTRFARIRQRPGMNVIVDPIAAKLIDRYKIRTLILPASDLEKLHEIVRGAPHSGTTVEPVE